MSREKKINYMLEQARLRHYLDERQTDYNEEVTDVHLHGKVNNATDGVIELFELMGGSMDNPDTETTPERFMAAMMELTQGYNVDPMEYLNTTFENNGNYDEMILSAGIPFVSLCEHHMLPFMGEISIAYIPKNDKIVGLSKLARLALGYAQRLQVQENLTTQIRQALDIGLQPLGSAVIISAKHTCQCYRGVRADGVMLTSSLSGVFRDDINRARDELFKMLDLAKKL